MEDGESVKILFCLYDVLTLKFKIRAFTSQWWIKTRTLNTRVTRDTCLFKIYIRFYNDKISNLVLSTESYNNFFFFRIRIRLYVFIIDLTSD
jgi:hypothetical protein